MNDRSKARGILSDSRFPEADHTPSRRLQFPALFEVASHVPFNLGDPIIRVVTTREASFPPYPVASVPKVAGDENHDPGRGEDEIGHAGQSAIVAAGAEIEGSEREEQRLLGSRPRLGRSRPRSPAGDRRGWRAT